MDISMNRRHLLQGGLTGAACLALGSQVGARFKADFPPVRVITRGPRHHWFGYYDKLQFDPTSRYVLGMEVDFQHRSPTGKDRIAVGMVDLQDGDRWIPFGHRETWTTLFIWPNF